MVKNQQARLNEYAAIIEGWRVSQSIAIIEYIFYEMMNFDQTRNEESWKAIRKALSKNRGLGYDNHRNYLKHPPLAEQYWWFDPVNWIVPKT